jgi:hypothetical protein
MPTLFGKRKMEIKNFVPGDINSGDYAVGRVVICFRRGFGCAECEFEGILDRWKYEAGTWM